MSEKTSMSKRELELHLAELKEEYSLARMGLAKGGLTVMTAIVGLVCTLGVSLFAFLKRGEGFINGNHYVALVLIVAFAAVIYFSFVFGRTAKLRAEISETRKLLEMSSGDSVR
jgi:hypothetical protein